MHDPLEDGLGGIPVDCAHDRASRTSRAHTLIEGLRLLPSDLPEDYGGLAESEGDPERLVGPGQVVPVHPVVHEHGLDLVPHLPHALPGELDGVLYGQYTLGEGEFEHQRRQHGALPRTPRTAYEEGGAVLHEE